MSPLYVLERYKPGAYPEHLATGDLTSMLAAVEAHGGQPDARRLGRLGRCEQAVFRAPDGFTLHVGREL